MSFADLGGDGIGAEPGADFKRHGGLVNVSSLLANGLLLGDYIRKWRKGLTIELREDLRLKGTFKDAVKALLRPARLRHMIPTKPR